MTPQDQPRAGVAELRQAMQEACDLLAERTYGSSSRSPAHHARLVLEAALSAPTAQADQNAAQREAKIKAVLRRLLIAHGIGAAGRAINGPLEREAVDDVLRILSAHPCGDAGADSLSLRSIANHAQDHLAGAVQINAELAAENERLKHEVAALRRSLGQGGTAEPIGCPTPGACSCPTGDAGAWRPVMQEALDCPILATHEATGETQARMRAVLQSPIGAWRPISEAPRDGRHLLLGGCKWGPEVRDGSWGCCRYNRSTKKYDQGWNSGPSDYGFDPTHFMEFPQPPSPEETSDAT